MVSMPGQVKSESDQSKPASPVSPCELSFLPASTLQAYGDCSQVTPSSSPPLAYAQMYPDTQGLSYPMYPYPTDSEAYFLGNEPSIKVEYTGSSTLDDRDRRRKRSALVKEKEALSNMHMRRRAQNRASQRAFRDRKEKHVKDLEHQLEDLGSKHEALLKSYSDLSNANEQLSKELERLTSENGSLRSSRDSSTFSALLTPKELECFGGSDGLYPSGPSFYYDEALLGADRLLDPCNDAI